MCEAPPSKPSPVPPTLFKGVFFFHNETNSAPGNHTVCVAAALGLSAGFTAGTVRKKIIVLRYSTHFRFCSKSFASIFIKYEIFTLKKHFLAQMLLKTQATFIQWRISHVRDNGISFCPVPAQVLLFKHLESLNAALLAASCSALCCDFSFGNKTFRRKNENRSSVIQRQHTSGSLFLDTCKMS